MGWVKNLFGDKGVKGMIDPFGLVLDLDEEGNPMPKVPEYQEDKDYREAQDYLKNFGIDLLSGNIPEYYSPIGEIGGTQFEKYLSGVKGDIETSVLNSSAAIGRSGGSVQSAIAEQTGDVSNKARYADYLRALEGRGNFMIQGINTMQGVRDSGLREGTIRNDFNLSAYDRERQNVLYEQQQKMMEDQAMMDLLGTAVMGGVGFAVGGPVGALTAATGTDWSSILSKTNTYNQTPNTVSGDLSKKIDYGRLSTKPLSVTV